MAEWFSNGAIATIAAAAISALAMWIGNLLTGRTQKGVANIEARGPEWEAFTQQIQEWTNKQLAERDEDIAQLRVEVSSLRDKLEVWRSRYFIAVHYIRQWRLRHPESVDELPIPDELEQDF